jgi:hypothetical protein
MKERYVVAGLEYIAEDVHLYLALHNGFKTKLQAERIVDSLYDDDQVLECKIFSVSELQEGREDGNTIKSEDIVYRSVI